MVTATATITPTATVLHRFGRGSSMD
jgi:hypothetical protein